MNLSENISKCEHFGVMHANQESPILPENNQGPIGLCEPMS